MLPPDRAHSKKTEAQALLPIASNHKGERELDSVFYQKKRKKKIFLSNDFFAFYIRRLSSLLLIQLNPSFHIPSESSSD
jgi:hypothetical protein